MASELPGSDSTGPDSTGSDTWPGLCLLTAQAAHVLQAARTIIGSRGDSGDTHHDTTSLRESLQDELGDLRAAVDYVIGKNGLDWDAVNRRRDRKRTLYERWHQERRSAAGAPRSSCCQVNAPRP
jgi:hypothetical protein